MNNKSSIGLLLLLVALLGWFVVVRTQVAHFSDVVFQTDVKNQELASYDARIKNINDIKQNHDRFDAVIKAFYVAMPKASQVPEVMVMVEHFGSASGIVFNSVSIGTPSGSDVPVNLTFTGREADIYRFMDTINNNIRTALVKNQTVTSDSQGNLTVSMQLGLVYQGD